MTIHFLKSPCIRTSWSEFFPKNCQELPNLPNFPSVRWKSEEVRATHWHVEVYGWIFSSWSFCKLFLIPDILHSLINYKPQIPEIVIRPWLDRISWWIFAFSKKIREYSSLLKFTRVARKIIFWMFIKFNLYVVLQPSMKDISESFTTKPSYGEVLARKHPFRLLKYSFV